MNEDKFIDQALREHARLEHQADEAFLTELEGKLDQQPQLKPLKEKSKITRFIPHIVSTMVACIALFLTVPAIMDFDKSKK